MYIKIGVQNWCSDAGRGNRSNVPFLLSPPQISHGLVQDRTRASALKGEYRDCRLPLQLNWNLQSYGLLYGVRWFETDVSGLPIGHMFKGQVVQEEPWRWDQQVITKRRLETTSHRVRTQRLNNSGRYNFTNAAPWCICPICCGTFGTDIVFRCNFLSSSPPC